MTDKKYIIELPCKIGDEVWCIKKYNGVPTARRGKVSQMFFLDDMRLSITIKGYVRGEWGKTIFATQEETQKKIESENI